MSDQSSSSGHKKADPENIVDAIRILFEPGQVVELRVPKAGSQGTISGYFDDHAKLAAELEKLSGHVEAAYYTLNPVNPALLARANNRAKPYAKGLTTDEPDNILMRRWLLVDCDPARPSEIPSTADEKGDARETAKRIRDHLKLCRHARDRWQARLSVAERLRRDSAAEPKPRTNRRNLRNKLVT